MTTRERAPGRARHGFPGSAARWVLFCLRGGGSWSSLASSWISKTPEVLGFLSRIFAWSLPCMADELRRTAL
ncbi:MAG TPA: hypothetical protein VMU54_18365 [Planctomycetota bacterium]|nr:hypothetical protein [Planctomycetota bacterium]